MKNDTNWQNLGIGIIAITIIGLIILGLIYEIGQAPWQFITVLIALLGALITLAGNIQIQIRNEQKPQKIEIYDKVIQIFFDIIFGSKIGNDANREDELASQLAAILPDLIMWSSDEVLKLYIEFRQNSKNSNIDNEVFNRIVLFGELLLAMLKYLGHSNNGVNRMSILGSFVNDIEHLSKIEQSLVNSNSNN